MSSVVYLRYEHNTCRREAIYAFGFVANQSNHIYIDKLRRFHENAHRRRRQEREREKTQIRVANGDLNGKLNALLNSKYGTTQTKSHTKNIFLQ